MNKSNYFPILATFDYGAAFPSLIHAFLFLVLRRANFLEGMLNISNGIYFIVAAVGRTETGKAAFLFWILRGVLQGCPLAGSFFALAIDPFLVKFSSSIDDNGKGKVRGCADDIGIALRDIRDLALVKHIFDEAKLHAGLALKPAKGCIVPLCDACPHQQKVETVVPVNAQISKYRNENATPQQQIAMTTDEAVLGSPGAAHLDLSQECLILFVKEWLGEYIPEWSSFQAKHAAKYLGAFLGPKAGFAYVERSCGQVARPSILHCRSWCPHPRHRVFIQLQGRQYAFLLGSILSAPTRGGAT
jgi:hypothetical protein